MIIIIRSKIDKMYEVVRKINQIYEMWAAGHGLTLYELQIYYEMMKNNNVAITQKDLCMRLDAPKTSINSIIKKQLKSGRIEMRINPLNKREKILSLTVDGQEFAKELIKPLFQYEEEAASMLNEQELEKILEIQSQFADILLERVEQGNE